MQGDNHANFVEGNSINIGSSFSEKKKQIDGMCELIDLVQSADY